MNKTFTPTSRLAFEKSMVSIQKEALLRVALVFPNSYEVGMANLGFQELFRIFNQFENVSCERVFWDPTSATKAESFDNHRPLRDFDIIAFSISFELDYPNMVQLLHTAKIPLRSKQRHLADPLIICGGAITFINPVPISPIIDAFVLGEAGTQPEFLIKTCIEYRKQLHSPDCLEALAKNESIWVPELDTTTRRPRRRNQYITETPISSSVISEKSHFRKMFLIEAGRACGRGCRFCAAGYVYRPVRFFPMETIVETVKKNPFHAKRIGLVGSALSDYPDLPELCRRLVAEGHELGLSSFRLDVITPELLDILSQGGVKSLTVAPEAGTDRLRQIIHKQLSAQDIQNALNAFQTSAIRSLKFYFMIGLPFENDADIDGIIDIVNGAAEQLGNGFRLGVSVNAFIPKPWTPFQWTAMEHEKSLKQKRKRLNQAFSKIKGLSFSTKSTRTETLQALFSKGDVQIADLLIEHTLNGNTWTQLLKSHRDLVNSIVYHESEEKDQLAWDFIDNGINRESLWKHWQAAKKIAVLK